MAPYREENAARDIVRDDGIAPGAFDHRAQKACYGRFQPAKVLLRPKEVIRDRSRWFVLRGARRSFPRVFREALSVGDEASRLLGEKHSDVFKGVLCEVGYRLRRFPPLNRSFADAEDLRRLDLRHAGHINRATLSGESCSRHGLSIRRLRGEFNRTRGHISQRPRRSYTKRR